MIHYDAFLYKITGKTFVDGDTTRQILSYLNKARVDAEAMLGAFLIGGDIISHTVVFPTIPVVRVQLLPCRISQKCPAPCGLEDKVYIGYQDPQTKKTLMRDLCRWYSDIEGIRTRWAPVYLKELELRLDLVSPTDKIEGTLILPPKEIYEQNKVRDACISCGTKTQEIALFTGIVKYCKKCCG